MGETKTNMTPKTDSGKSVFGKLSDKWAKKKDTNAPAVVARTFADNLSDAYEMLGKLIITKESDLANESGKEVVNRKSVALLRSMEFHLESALQEAAEYANL